MFLRRHGIARSLTLNFVRNPNLVYAKSPSIKSKRGATTQSELAAPDSLPGIGPLKR